MIAVSLGLPLFIIVVAGVHYYLMPFVGERFVVTGFGISLGICAVYFLRGCDKWFEQKKDNPEPFDCPTPIDEAFGNVIEVLENRHIGPYWWTLRARDTEELRIQATLNFSEEAGFIGMQSTMLQRLMMLDISFDEIPQEPISLDDEQKEIEERGHKPKKNLTQVRLQWFVDSPGNRVKCNEIIDDHTRELRKNLGLYVSEHVEEKSIFMPPTWALIVAGLMAWGCFQQFEKFEAKKTKYLEQQQQKQERRQAAADKRQQQIDAANERRLKQQEKYNQDRLRRGSRSSGTDRYTSPGNSFAPILTPENTKPRRYQPKIPSYQKKQNSGLFKDPNWSKPKSKTLDPYYKP